MVFSRPFRAIFFWSRWIVQQIPLLAAQIARPMVAYLDAGGADSEAFLNRARIPREVVASGGWVTKKQVYDLLHDVVQRERRPGVILSAFSGFDINDLGPIAVAMRSSRTVKDALRVLTRLAGLAYEGNSYFLRTIGGTSWLCYREGNPVSDGQIAAQQATLAIFLKIIRLSVDERWRPRQLRSQVRMNKDLGAAEGWEECRQVHDCDHTAVAFPLSFMRRELAWAEEPQSSIDTDTTWQPEMTFDDRFVDSLHRLIASHFLFRALPTLDHVAGMVGLSARTIKRRLSCQGLSYRHLLDRICFDAARDMLLVEKFSVKETARALGYSDTSKFVRSFRRMTGVTPGQFRHLAH
jgi:AraC-like DNA-binding protein